MKELLEAGVHFGHQVRRWNPKMKEYIFGERNGIYIIDLQKTQKMFREAIQFMTNLIAEDRGKTVLFVGTKRQAQDAVREEAERSGMFYVNQRWLGGLLTNFQTVQKSIKRLKDLDVMQTDGRYEKLTKKERIKLDRERLGLEKVLSGIKSMTRLPDSVFVIDVRKEEIAVAEGQQMLTEGGATTDEPPSQEGAAAAIETGETSAAETAIEGAATQPAPEETGAPETAVEDSPTASGAEPVETASPDETENE